MLFSLHAWRRVVRLTSRVAEGRDGLTPRMAEGSAAHSTQGGGYSGSLTCTRKGLMHEANMCKCCSLRVSGATAN